MLTIETTTKIQLLISEKVIKGLEHIKLNNVGNSILI